MVIAFLGPGSLQGLVLGAAFAITAVCLLESLGRQEETSQSRASSVLDRIWPLVFPTSYLVFILALFLVPPLKGELFLNPLSIPLGNWFRWVSALMLTTFYPGYAILRLIDRKGTLGKIPRFLFAYVISMTLTAMMGFAILGSGNGIQQGNSELLLSLSSLALLGAYVAVSERDGGLLRWGRESGKQESSGSSSLLFLTLAGAALILAIYLTYGSQIIQDQRAHVGVALILSHGFPVVNGVASVSYPWLFDAYGAVLIGLSGIPSANVYNLMGLLEIVPLVSFFFMVRSFVRDKFSAEVSTFLAFFTSGFGWLYFLYAGNGTGSAAASIYTAWLKTYDILTPSTFLLAGHPDVGSPLQLTVLVAGPLLLSIAYVPGMRALGKLRYLLLSTAAFFAYMGHPEALVFFSIILLALPLMQDGWKLGLSLTSAILCILIVDFFAPGRYYTVSPQIALLGRETSLLYLLLVSSIAFTALSASVQLGRQRVATFLRRLSNGFSENTVAIICVVTSVLALSGYLLSFLVWSLVQSSYVTWLTFGFNGSVPWYLYPLRFGVVEFIALCGSIYLLLSRKTSALRSLSPFYLLMLIALLLSPYYLEYRMDKYVYLGLSVIAGYSVADLVLRLSKTTSLAGFAGYGHTLRIDGKKVASVVVIAILVTSMPSEILFLEANHELTSQNDNSTVLQELARVLPGRTPPSSAEMAALTWLSLNINPLTDGVLMVPNSGGSNNVGSEAELLSDYGGAWNVLTDRYAPIFQVTDATNFFELASNIQPKYAYITSADVRTLASNPIYANSYLKEMINQFPVAYNNSEVTIYSVPRVSPPSKNSAVGVLPGISNVEFTSLATGGLNYTVVTNSNYNLSSIKTLILGQPPPGGLLDDLLRWVRAGGNLVSLYYMNESFVFTVHNGTITGLRTGSPSLVALQNGTLAASGEGYAIFDKNAPAQFILSGELEALTPTSTDNHLGLIFDYKNSSNYYYLFERSNSLVLYKMYKGNGLEVYYDPNFVRQSGFHDLEVKSVPPLLTFSVDGTVVGQYNDSSPLPGGYVGYRWHNLASKFGPMTLVYSTSKHVSVNGVRLGSNQSSVGDLTVPSLSLSQLPRNSSNVSYFTENGSSVSVAAFSQPVGKGTVAYVNMPILENAYSTPSTSIWKILQATAIFGNLGIRYPNIQNFDSPPAPLTQPLDYEAGTINMTGTVSIQSNYMTAPWAGLTIESNDSAITGTLNSLSVWDSTNMTATSNFGTISNGTIGSYPELELEMPITLNIDLGKSVPLAITTTDSQGNVQTFTKHGGELTLRLSNGAGTIPIVAETPSVVTKGVVKMTYAAIGNANALGGYGPLVITGPSRFEVSSVDNGIIRLSDFGTSGQLAFHLPAQEPWNEWNIPWTTNAILEYTFVVLWLCLVTMYLSGVLLADPIQSPMMRREGLTDE
jgi:hypothetical protein